MDRERLRNYWEDTYKSTETPFDVQGPDEWIAKLDSEGQIGASVLECGCGPGRTSLYLAERGHRVLGVDISQRAIERARQRAAERNITVEFRSGDVLELPFTDARFDTVVDIGCFHSLCNDGDRAAYAAKLHSLCRADACVFLRALSLRNPNGAFVGGHSPLRSEAEIRSAFEPAGWNVAMLEERELDLFIAREDQPRVWAWFATLRRSSALVRATV